MNYIRNQTDIEINLFMGLNLSIDVNCEIINKITLVPSIAIAKHQRKPRSNTASLPETLL